MATNINREVVIVTCTVQHTPGGQCSKRPCRYPERGEIGKRMYETGVHGSVLQKQYASDNVIFGEDVPAYVYDAQTFRDAKHKFVSDTHVHKLPLTALCILKSNALKNELHSIGAYPFYVWYSSVQQLHIYQAYCRTNAQNVKVAIDATGTIVSKIMRPDGSISGHVFLYECVIYWQNQQFSVNQMLTEKHDSVHIANWLRNWKKLGAPPPKELVSDDGKALIIAAINSFTKFYTITEYVNACFLKKKIPCFIRIDVAHFMHKYAILLKESTTLVKKFFLVAIGQLILSRSDNEAYRILKCVLLISQSQSCGHANGELTECSKSIKFIKDNAMRNGNQEITKFFEGKQNLAIAISLFVNIMVL